MVTPNVESRSIHSPLVTHTEHTHDPIKDFDHCPSGVLACDFSVLVVEFLSGSGIRVVLAL